MKSVVNCFISTLLKVPKVIINKQTHKNILTMGKTEMVKSSIVKVSGIPTNIFTIGEDIHDRPNEVVLVIPG